MYIYYPPSCMHVVGLTEERWSHVRLVKIRSTYLVFNSITNCIAWKQDNIGNCKSTHATSQAKKTSSNSSDSVISFTTSNPPTNSPLTMNCGKVGQSLSFFRPVRGNTINRHHLKTCVNSPCRTASSLRISK
jgi:hypothetical protein